MSEFDPSAEPARFAVKKVFKSSKAGNVYGCFVEAGTVRAGDAVTINGCMANAWGLGTLRRFSEDVKEVQAGYEFGFTWEDVGEHKQCGPPLEAGDVLTVVRPRPGVKVLAPALLLPGQYEADPFVIEGAFRHCHLRDAAIKAGVYSLRARDGFLVVDWDGETRWRGRFHAALIARQAGQAAPSVEKLYTDHLWDDEGRALWER